MTMLVRYETDPFESTWTRGIGAARKTGARQGSTRTAASKLEAAIERHLRALKLPACEREYRFHPTRKWRFDFAWPSRKLAVEVQGGIWIGGKHSRGAGIEKDAEKLNEAQLLGWVVLLVTPAHIRTGMAVQWIERALRGGSGHDA